MTGDHDIKHMKWWGWGVDGVAFHHHDKPGFAPFVKHAVHLDLATAEAVVPPELESLPVPVPKLTDAFAAQLAEAVGADHVHTDTLDRIVHTYGKSLRDLVRLRRAIIPRIPDAVLYPAGEDQVRAIVDLAVAEDAVIIPFGGGTNISGSLEPPADETRPVLSVDLGRMNKVLDIDAESGLARIQAGTLGPDLEQQLGARGWTMGHFPDSFTHSTVGGWVATRSSGMQSDKYGDIADITRGLRLVVPGDVLTLRPLPSTATGPSVREMVLGSEGRLGIITEVTVQVHRLPEQRVILGYLFPSWEAGLAAMQEIAASDAAPIVTRVSDSNETSFSFATSKAKPGLNLSGKIQKGMFAVLEKRGWDMSKVCLSFIGYEGAKKHVAYEKKLVKTIVSRHGGIVVGTGPGRLYDQKKFDTPYIRDFLLDRGAAGDVSETAAPWSRLMEVYDNTVAAAQRAYDEIGRPGWIMCHLSHSYHSGACLYFTFAFVHGEEDPLAEYDVVKSAIQQSFVDHGGTLSHHHAVGTEHSRWLEQEISAPGVAMIDGVLGAIDPGRNLNPEKITGH
ncbi:MAG: FAD-binding oxidoreductase [Microlunatus sp.]